MDNGTITEYDCGFDEYFELTRPAAPIKMKTANNKNRKKGNR
jgi:hypothetical protein